MDTFEITQVLLSVSTLHEVRMQGKPELLYTVKGSLTSASPNFTLAGKDGKEVATLHGNFIKTRYQVTGEDKKEIAHLQFPAVAIKKTLTLTVGETEYSADGGVFKGVFQCKAPSGDVALEISKTGGLRDIFVVKTSSIPTEVGLLAAVAIHSRFYEMV